ncbi:prepilin-type N-terminal cleavage/methylation domain-containing protein [Stenotrophomonas maltophilia]|nr:prepilin-type N-terminal cleavage/methylation domain-containing protein [Stenotrophomonas maltophilia]
MDGRCTDSTRKRSVGDHPWNRAAMPPIRRLQQCGLSLIELVAVLAALAILCSLALPPLARHLDHWHADMVRMRLVSVFNSARATALTHRRPVTVCPSQDGIECSDDWVRGWLIETEPAAFPADVAVRRQFQPGTQASGVRAGISSGRRRLRFQADGRSAGSTLTVQICAGSRLHGTVVVNNIGRTRSTRQQVPAPCPL